MTDSSPATQAEATGPKHIAPGLHFIATPIGAARDITLRALDLLAAADVLAAEDTRSLRHLMEIHGIALARRPLLAYHDHNEAAALPRIMAALEEGKTVVYASEAGTPLVSDPGFGLARAVIAAGLPLFAAPGPSAALCALTLSGLPSDRFMFAGFAPSARMARQTFLASLAPVEATIILYESPKRVRETLGDLVQCFGKERRMALCRELTKRFEEVRRGTVEEVLTSLGQTDPKGEIVLVIDRAPPMLHSEESIQAALDAALRTMSVKDAATAVAEETGMPRRQIYQLALARGR